MTRRDQIEIARERLEQRMKGLVQKRRERIGWATERLEQRIQRVVRAKRAELGRLAGQIEALSPLQALSRGYAVPLDERGHILRRRAQFEPGAPFRLRVVDGDVDCRVSDADE